MHATNNFFVVALRVTFKRRSLDALLAGSRARCGGKKAARKEEGKNKRPRQAEKTRIAIPACFHEILLFSAHAVVEGRDESQSGFYIF